MGVCRIYVMVTMFVAQYWKSFRLFSHEAYHLRFRSMQGQPWMVEGLTLELV